MLITGELQLEKKPPRRQLLTFHVKDTWLQLSPVEQPWDTAVSRRLPLTEHIVPLRASPVLLWHPQCCEMSLALACQPCPGFALHWGSLLYWLWVLNQSAEFKVWAEVKNAVPSLNHHRVRFHLLISTEHLSHRYQFLAHITNCSRVMPGINLFVRIFQWGSTGQSTTYSFHKGFI